MLDPSLMGTVRAEGLCGAMAAWAEDVRPRVCVSRPQTGPQPASALQSSPQPCARPRAQPMCGHWAGGWWGGPDSSVSPGPGLGLGRAGARERAVCHERSFTDVSNKPFQEIFFRSAHTLLPECIDRTGGKLVYPTFKPGFVCGEGVWEEGWWWCVCGAGWSRAVAGSTGQPRPLDQVAAQRAVCGGVWQVCSRPKPVAVA